MTPKARWVLGAVGAVAVGAIGSGVWDLVLKKLVLWTLDGVFRASSLGIATLRDSAYQDAARGWHEHAASQVLEFIPAVFLGLYTAMLTRRRWMLFRLRRLRRVPPGIPRRRARAKQLQYVVFTGLAAAVFLALMTFRTSYVNRLVGRFEQTMAIAGPYLALAEEKSLRSDFARVRTASEYEAVMSRLKTRLQENGVQPPK